jgi:tryptophan synthase beta subunit
MNDIQRIISSTLPQQDMNDMTRLLEAFLQASGGGNNTVGNPVAPRAGNA